jgi:hypothetical protein
MKFCPDMRRRLVMKLSVSPPSIFVSWRKGVPCILMFPELDPLLVGEALSSIFRPVVMDKSGAGAGFLRELRFLHLLSTIIFTITRGWHNRPGVAAVPIVSQTK